MTDNFPEFAKIVHKSYQKLVTGGAVFDIELADNSKNEKGEDVVVINGDALYARYLAAFPEGTNPWFKNRTEHDCACCRQFVKRAGTVVGVHRDGHGRAYLKTVWDEAAVAAPHPYNEVAAKLRDAVRDAPIANLYRVGKSEVAFGSEKTHSLSESGQALTWNHFYSGAVPTALRPDQPDTDKGAYRTTTQVFERGLTELKPEAVETVLSLIQANNLYRGEEHNPALLAFQKSQNEFLKGSVRERHLFIWEHARGPASRLRNTAIGTLVQDLSEGRDIDGAVQSFEAKVAPQNYKRTTAVVTPTMVKNALETIRELGLEPALERRYARLEDISVNDVKWVDTGVKPLMKGGLADLLIEHAFNTKSAKVDEQRTEEIGMSDFLQNVLPQATGMELLFQGEHLGNLVSLTAPVHPETKQLFRWTNDFAWSYAGGVADSIRERVKKAGGKVEGAKLRISLSWYNYDDLDLHVFEPVGKGSSSVRNEIYYGNKRGWTQGCLDVDMNVSDRGSRDAVENVAWSVVPPNGEYKVVVNNFTQREHKDVGFVIEVESHGKVSHFSYNKAVRYKQDVHVCTLHVSGGVVEKIDAGDPGVSATNVSQERWGLKTEQFVKVNAVTLSPNYWGENAVGNKHTFFLLDGCKNDEPTRGIYNEFLHPRLEPHRKVFELIGEKTQCQPTDGQLSGLGYSSTKKDSVIVKVFQSKRQRLFKVNSGE